MRNAVQQARHLQPFIIRLRASSYVPQTASVQSFQRRMGCLAGVWVPALQRAVREVERLVRELRSLECLSAADAELVHSVLRAFNFLRKAASRDAAWPSELAAADAQGAQLLTSAMRATAQLLQVKPHILPQMQV